MDRIILPQKFDYLNDEIQNRIISRFLLILDRKKVADAADKGYTELSINELEKKLSLRDARLWVIAEKPGNTSETDFIKIKEIPGGIYHNIPVAMSINEVKSEYANILSKSECNIFYPPYTITKAKDVKSGALDRLCKNPDNILSCPTCWLPYEIIIRDIRLRKVQDYDWEGLQLEGMNKYTVSQEEYDEDPDYWEKHTNSKRENFGLCWNVEKDELNYANDKDTLYRRFIRSVYGQKVWDNNETVVELTVFPGLCDNYYYNNKEFLKYCEALLPEDEVEMYRKRFKDSEKNK